MIRVPQMRLSRRKRATVKSILKSIELLARTVRNALNLKSRRKLTKEVRSLRAELAKVPRYSYGSYTQGRGDWAQKWEVSSGRRILFYAYKDYSGSFYKWADALNRHTPYAVRLAALQSHPYKYSYDLILPHDDTHLTQLASEADLIHIKDETGFFDHGNGLPPDIFTRTGKPLIYTAYGGMSRKHADDQRFRAHVSSFDDRVALTPDLNHDWFNGHFVPHAIDTEEYTYSWRNGNVLAHSPSNQNRKGTPELIKAISGLDMEFDLISGVAFEECIARKRVANLFFDQAGAENKRKLGVDTVIGWYGNSAIEAAVFGIPTIVHLSQAAFEGARRAGKDIEQSCAFINTPRGTDGIRNTLVDWLRMPLDERTDLSVRTRRYIEEFHSYESCAAALSAVYDKHLWRVPEQTNRTQLSVSVWAGKAVEGEGCRTGVEAAEGCRR